MASRPKVTVNGRVLAWARTTAGLTVQEAAKRAGVKPERYESWEAGQAMTLGQLEALARAFGRTPAFFFIPTTPQSRDTPDQDFRGAGATPSPALAREILKAGERRRAFIASTSERIDRQVPTLPRNKTLAESIPQVRQALGVSIETQMGFKDSAVALRTWIDAVNRRFGVLVFQMSGIPLDECRGFSIYEAEHAVIVINGADTVEARVFTLFHELGHLILRSGGICTLYTPSGIERQCNAFAGALLIPRTFVQDLDVPLDHLSELAGLLKVSQSAIAVRLRDLDLITQEQLNGVLADAARIIAEARERQRELQRRSDKKSFVPRYELQLRNLGRWYVGTVLDAMNSDVISRTDAAYYLESKLSTVARMEQVLATRADTSAIEAAVA
jgi:Zn-dependent peptidase ImmA (M78 family)